MEAIYPAIYELTTFRDKGLYLWINSVMTLLWLNLS